MWAPCSSAYESQRRFPAIFHAHCRELGQGYALCGCGIAQTRSLSLFLAPSLSLLLSSSVCLSLFSSLISLSHAGCRSLVCELTALNVWADARDKAIQLIGGSVVALRIHFCHHSFHTCLSIADQRRESQMQVVFWTWTQITCCQWVACLSFCF